MGGGTAACGIGSLPGHGDDALLNPSCDVSKASSLHLTVRWLDLGHLSVRVIPGLIQTGAKEALSTLTHRDLSQKANV